MRTVGPSKQFQERKTFLHLAKRVECCRCAVTNWLSDNAADIIAVLKTRSPTSRFKSTGARDLEASEFNSKVVTNCIYNLEREIAKVWSEAQAEELQTNTESLPSIWGVAVSGGAANVLVSSPNFRVFVPATAVARVDSPSCRESEGLVSSSMQSKTSTEFASRLPPEWQQLSLKNAVSLAEAQGLGLSGKRLPLCQCVKGAFLRGGRSLTKGFSFQ